MGLVSVRRVEGLFVSYRSAKNRPAPSFAPQCACFGTRALEGRIH